MAVDMQSEELETSVSDGSGPASELSRGALRGGAAPLWRKGARFHPRQCLHLRSVLTQPLLGSRVLQSAAAPSCEVYTRMVLWREWQSGSEVQ